MAIRSAASIPGDKIDAVGGADDLSYFIKRVTFRLHETYPSPNRSAYYRKIRLEIVIECFAQFRYRQAPFRSYRDWVHRFAFKSSVLKLILGFLFRWGEFDINIRVTFVAESGEKTLSFMHHLKLHPWAMPDVAANPTSDPATLYAPPPTTSTSTPGDPNAPSTPVPLQEPVHSWQYDEIVFTDPPKQFLDILLANPPTPLPKTKKRPNPPNPAHVLSLGPQPLVPGTPSKGGGSDLPEFTQVLERDEAERLDAAKRAVLDATDAQRVLLIEREQELKRLKELET